MTKQAYDKDGNKINFAIYEDDYVVDESEPSILEYVVVIILVIVTTIAQLFKQKKEKNE